MMKRGSNTTVVGIQRELRELGNPDIARHSLRFFKTGPGQYGAGDRFLGIRVPALRVVAKKFKGSHSKMQRSCSGPNFMRSG